MGRDTKGPELGNTKAAREGTAGGPELERSNPKCPACRHLLARHVGRACGANRSTPGGRVYPCDCRLQFREPSDALPAGSSHALQPLVRSGATGLIHTECSCGWTSPGCKTEQNARVHHAIHASGREKTPAVSSSPRALSPLSPLERELLGALRDILDYRGGADSALDDEHVVDRARAAIARAEGRS